MTLLPPPLLDPLAPRSCLPLWTLGYLPHWLYCTNKTWLSKNQPTVRRQGVFILFCSFGFPHLFHIVPVISANFHFFFPQRKCFFSLSRPRCLYPKSACKMDGPSKWLPCTSSADHTLVTVPPCPLLPLRQNGP